MHCRICKLRRYSLSAVASVFIAMCRSTCYRRQQYQLSAIYLCLQVHSTIIESTEHVCSLSCSFPYWLGSDLSAKCRSLFFSVSLSPSSAYTLEFLLQTVAVVLSKWHLCVNCSNVPQYFDAVKWATGRTSGLYRSCGPTLPKSRLLWDTA